ncbi:MAG: hypothetical protein OXT67_01810 [Zetaproteobacteria bacterium]|nr:hypothetical protein [Zetaproteobacteria bacterium]
MADSQTMRLRFSHFMLLLGLLLCASPAAQSESIPLKLRQKTEENTRLKLRNLLSQYCATQCELISIEVQVDEKVPDHLELGFEGIHSRQNENIYEVSSIRATVQIDDRVSQKDRNRLQNILTQGIAALGKDKANVALIPVELPNIGEFEKIAGNLRHSLEKKMSKVIDKVFNNYCPHRCILGHVTVYGKLITSDEAAALSETQVYVQPGSNSILHIDKAKINITLDEDLSPEERVAIVRLIRAKLNFVDSIDLEVDTIPFPESFDEKQRKQKLESEDPYGLEKLRRMLVLFRELAGTKEIISRSETKDSNTSTEVTDSKESLSSSEKSAESKDFSASDWAMYIGGFCLLMFILIFLLMRFGQANRDAKVMIESAKKAGESEEETEGNLNTENDPEDPLLVFEKEKLIKDLSSTFMNSPKVARETFMRMLQENGVEETSKYLHILGKMVVYELLEDPALQRQLYELGDFYHKSDFSFTLEEEVELLRKLKTMVTANEIRVMAKNSLDQFEFLSKLNPAQIVQLTEDESPQVQSLVLTQLNPQLRLDVFEIYSSEHKNRLTKELCRAEAIPKEFLHNVAAALKRKVASKPEFDAETVRTSDILLELIEKAKANEQRNIMSSLLQTNPDAARAIKAKLVTLDVLNYIKTGHLLEIILGIEQEDLLLFLAGAPDHISQFVMRQAPEELVHSWEEELNSMGAVEDSSYRIIEAKILNKVRQLARSGVIDLLEVNETIFANLQTAEEDEEDRIKAEHLIA